MAEGGFCLNNNLSFVNIFPFFFFLVGWLFFVASTVLQSFGSSLQDTGEIPLCYWDVWFCSVLRSLLYMVLFVAQYLNNTFQRGGVA